MSSGVSIIIATTAHRAVVVVVNLDREMCLWGLIEKRNTGGCFLAAVWRSSKKEKTFPSQNGFLSSFSHHVPLTHSSSHYITNTKH